jgi:nicotinate-nucleotide adenylyltransferase
MADRALGILGGTFDPIHYWHLELARELLATLPLSAVRFVPAGDPPHRAAPAASAADRLAMVSLALQGHPGLEADAREIARPGPSYSVLTLEELRAEAPSRPLALIVGADAFLGLPSWYHWQELFALTHVVVVARPGVPLDLARSPALGEEFELRKARDANALVAAPAGAIVVAPVTPHDISATSIREELSRGAAGVDAVRGLLPPAVLAYIERNQLYRSAPCPSERSPASP